MNRLPFMMLLGVTPQFLFFMSISIAYSSSANVNP